MLLSELTPGELAQRLQGDGLALRTGPFVFRIHSPVLLVAEGLGLLYGANVLAAPDEFVDFDAPTTRGRLLYIDTGGAHRR